MSWLDSWRNRAMRNMALRDLKLELGCSLATATQLVKTGMAQQEMETWLRQNPDASDAERDAAARQIKHKHESRPIIPPRYPPAGTVVRDYYREVVFSVLAERDRDELIRDFLYVRSK